MLAFDLSSRRSGDSSEPINVPSVLGKALAEVEEMERDGAFRQPSWGSQSGDLLPHFGWEVEMPFADNDSLAPARTVQSELVKLDTSAFWF